MLGRLSSYYLRRENTDSVRPVAGLETPPADLEPQEFPQRQDKAGLIVTDELDKAIDRCQAKVQRIAQECRRRNRRFRDIEFDIEEDRLRCLYGLDPADDAGISPSDVRRVPEIFKKPSFHVGDSASSEIIQGNLEDCWFLSALATMSTVPGLVEKICVARDEKVGVYGFIFYMDCGWVDVVIDDLLYSSVPRYEELSSKERSLYLDDKAMYDKTGRKGSKTLYFSSSGHENETWIPLIEKAYAKLHGDFKALMSGSSADAIEDLTGGVSTKTHLKDILDEDAFWTDELLLANKDRCFGCYIHGMKPVDNADILINGLVPGHAYSVVQAVEVKGKRFVKVRNPWGKTEWTGRWSDGSKEWTAEWLAALPEIGHSFGDDGQFLMEYEDFLTSWTMIGRTRLFDSSWVLSTQWLEVTSRPWPCAFSYGDVSFTLSVPEATPAVIVLARLNNRPFAELDGPFVWSCDFTLFKKGEKLPVASSAHDVLWSRSVVLEIDLEAGEYVVHVRLDRYLAKVKTFWEDNINNWSTRKLSKKWAQKSLSHSIAANFNPKRYESILPLPDDLFSGQDLTEMEIFSHEQAILKQAEKLRTPSSASKEPEDIVQPVASAPSEVSDPPLSTAPTAPSQEGGEATKDAATVSQASVDAPVATEPAAGESADSSAAHGTEDTRAVDQMPAPDAVSGPIPAAPADAPTAVDASTSSTKKSVSNVHTGYTCDGCKICPIAGPRYRCLDPTCHRFDLCSDCMDAHVHPSDHRMIRIDSPEDAKPLRSSNQEQEDKITLGLRVYTMRHAPVAVKGQLRHGEVLHWEKKVKASPQK